ncbi:ABC transporter family substrate-binding protein [Kutzneria sp. CA-103260]|uniref:ABC transporter family substrate-binding protein n=1 Tax=Kutzneria sp. CA-103260 TaxID=2802641 RepID=UPI001BA96B75|nr:ABC transporter family substrate-binding protein [Kutzneria sp. CA-103260]QUQ68278.1 ABC transporter family substrate-binding protein [Kutzneria sp. CA-103260]
MHGLKTTAASAAIAVVSMALVACGNSGATDTGSTETAQSLADKTAYNPQQYNNIKDGGTLTTALDEIPPQLNVFHGPETAYTQILWNWYNPILITFTADGEAQYNPDYLTNVKQEMAGGNTRITYTMNPKAVYNDGTPIDWTALEATWKANDGKDPAYVVNSSDGYDRITSVTQGLDSHQAVVTFNGIDLWWQGLFNTLLNPKALAPEVFNKGYINNPHTEWGAGPYVISKFDRQNGIVTFERNPKWWGRKGKLDSRTFLAMEDSASLNAFKNGQLDAVGVGSRDRLAQVTGQPGVQIRKGPSLDISVFVLNGGSPILSDPRARKAIFEGIDRNQIARLTFQGLNYSADPAGSMVLLPFQKGYQDDFGKVIQYSPNQARMDLDAAGWTAGTDGTRAKGGKQLQVKYVITGDDSVSKAVASGTGAMLKDIGVKLDIQQVPASNFSKVIDGKQFDMFYAGIAQGSPFGLATICQLFCSQSQFSRSGVNDPKNDTLIKSVNTLPTPQEQYAKGTEAEVAAFSTYGVMPTINPPDIAAVKAGLANYGADRYFDALPETIGWQK